MAIKISGSTIIDDSRNIVSGAGATFTGNVSFGYKNITNVGVISVDEIHQDATDITIDVAENGNASIDLSGMVTDPDDSVFTYTYDIIQVTQDSTDHRSLLR